jgi:hypothetical protein
LEFAVQAWSHWHQADKAVLEKVQQSAIAMVSSLHSREYEARLKELKMFTPEERRHQADMLHMFKIMTGPADLREEGWFVPPLPAAARTRQYADQLNVRPNHRRLEIRRNFFTVRAGHEQPLGH